VYLNSPQWSYLYPCDASGATVISVPPGSLESLNFRALPFWTGSPGAWYPSIYALSVLGASGTATPTVTNTASGAVRGALHRHLVWGHLHVLLQLFKPAFHFN
jgi:hypothetical protein